MNQDFYRNLISSNEGGLAHRILRMFLRAVAFIYKCGINARNFCYGKGLLRSYKAQVPVISVGNITAGGTGKTPLVIEICSLLERKSAKCAILTRGYKTSSGTHSDEPALLAKACPSASVIVNPDRIAGSRRALQEHNARILVMDDGFQHRRLKRDLDIIVIDATCPFGYGRLLPAGLLREPIRSLKRADAVILTRIDQVEPAEIEKIERTIAEIKPSVSIAKTIHRLKHARAMKNVTLSLDELREKRAFAFCGIGNPQAFFNSLEKLGIKLVGSKVYNDHHDYTKADITEIAGKAKELGAEIVLSTQKDWVKAALLALGTQDIVFAYLAVKLDFVEGFDTIEALIDKLIVS